MFLCMLIQGLLLSDLSAELEVRIGRLREEAQILRGSRAGRSRFGGVYFEEGVAYEERGRAGYEEAGPGIRRLSTADSMFR